MRIDGPQKKSLKVDLSILKPNDLSLSKKSSTPQTRKNSELKMKNLNHKKSPEFSEIHQIDGPSNSNELQSYEKFSQGISIKDIPKDLNGDVNKAVDQDFLQNFDSCLSHEESKKEPKKVTNPFHPPAPRPPLKNADKHRSSLKGKSRVHPTS